MMVGPNPGEYPAPRHALPTALRVVEKSTNTTFPQGMDNASPWLIQVLGSATTTPLLRLPGFRDVKMLAC